jgi:hypothetical protein
LTAAKNLEETRANRLKFVQAVYDLTGGNEHKIVSMWEIGEKLGLGGFGSEETQKIVQYLTGEGLVKGMALGGGIGITHYGIKEVEESMLHPNTPTYHFPPRESVTIISVGNMDHSQMQVNSPGSVQTTTISGSNLVELKEIMKLISEITDKVELEPSAKGDLEAEVQTIESQLKSSKPKLTVVTESLSSVKSILSNSVAIAKTAAPIVAPLIARISVWLLGAGG